MENNWIPMIRFQEKLFPERQQIWIRYQKKHIETTYLKLNKNTVLVQYPELDGLKLEGDYILEIPASNADISNIQYYEDIAEEYGIKLRFTEEIQ